MAISLKQAVVTQAVSGNAAFAATFGSNCTPGTLIVVVATCEDDTRTVSSVSDGTNTYTQAALGKGGHNIFAGTGCTLITRAQNSSSSALTVTVTWSAAENGRIVIFELDGAATSSELDSAIASVADSSTINTDDSQTLAVGSNNCFVVRGGTYITTSQSADSGYTTTHVDAGGSLSYHACEYILDAGASGNKTTTFTATAAQAGWSGAMAAFKVAAAGGATIYNRKIFDSPIFQSGLLS